MNRFGDDENTFSFCKRTSGRANSKSVRYRHFDMLSLEDLIKLCSETTDERVNSVLGAFDVNGKITDKQKALLVYYCVENEDLS